VAVALYLPSPCQAVSTPLVCFAVFGLLDFQNSLLNSERNPHDMIIAGVSV
jgi:hypothetical protein